MTAIEGLNVQTVEENEIKIPKQEITNYQDFKNKFDDNFLDDIKNDKITIYKTMVTPEVEEWYPAIPPQLYYVFEKKWVGKDFRIKESNLKSFLQLEEIGNEKDSLLEEVLLKTNIDVQTSAIRKDAAEQQYKEYLQEKNTVEDEQKEEETKVTTEVNQDLRSALPMETNTQLLLVVDDLIKEYKRFLKEDVSAGKTNNFLNEYSNDAKAEFKKFREWAQQRLQKLENIKKELEGMNSSEVKKTPNMYTLQRVHDYRIDIRDMRTDYEGKAIFGNRSESRMDIDTQYEAKLAKSYQLDMVKYNLEMNKLLEAGDLALLFNEDLEWYKNYLKDIAEGKITDLENNPFALKNPANTRILISQILSFPAQYPYFYGCIMRGRGQKVNVYTKGNTTVNWWSMFDKGWNLFVSWLEKLWIIDENDTTKKEAWAKFGKIGMIVGVAALWFTMIKKLFSKDEDKRKWIWWGLVWLVALNNIDWLKNWFKAAFGKNNPTQNEIETRAGVNNSPEYVDRVPPVMTTIQTIWGIPLKTLIDEGLVIEKNWALTLDYPAFESYVENSNLTVDEKTRILEWLNKAKADNSLITKWLWLLNINSLATLKDLAGNDPEKTLLDVDNLWEFFMALSSEVNAELKKRKLKPKDSAAWYLINKEYTLNKWLTEAKIQEYKDQWLLIEDTTPSTPNTLPGGVAVTRLTDLANRPDATINDAVTELQAKGIDVTVSWNKVTSYGKEIIIDEATKKIKGLDIAFKNNAELVSAASFINFIRFSTENSKATSENPFGVNAIERSIYFNDSKRYDITSTDTRIVKANIFNNSLGSISPSLDDNKDTFVNYLNRSRLWVENSMKADVRSFNNWKDPAFQLALEFPSGTDIMDINTPYIVKVKSANKTTPIVVNRVSDNNRIDWLSTTFSTNTELFTMASKLNEMVAKVTANRMTPYMDDVYKNAPFTVKNDNIIFVGGNSAWGRIEHQIASKNSLPAWVNMDATVNYLNDKFKKHPQEFNS